MDVRFEVQDLFEKLRPNAKIHESLEEAAEALNEIVTRQTKLASTVEITADGSDGASEKSDDEEDNQRGPIDDDEPEEEEEKQDDMEVFTFRHHLTVEVDADVAIQEDEEDEVALFHRNVEPEVDEEFNREFARIMSEALESRKGTSKTTFDVEPPTVRARTQSTTSDGPEDRQLIQFAVLSRRNKQVLPGHFDINYR